MTPNDQVDTEAMRTQLQQAIEGLHHQQTLIVQEVGFFIAADTLPVAYGLSQRSSGALLVASLIPLGAVVALWLSIEEGISFTYVAMRLEQQLLPGQVTICSTRLRLGHPAIYSQLMEALRTEDEVERYSMIERVTVLPDLLRFRATWAFLTLFVLQCALCILSFVASYRFL